MGLGLSIVQRLCALLGYELSLASEYGRGSAFGFTVPRGAAPERGADRAEVPVGRADLSGRLIVAIDDEAAIVEAMRVLMSGWGVEVIASLTGDDVLEAVHAAGRMPDLIVADYRLGGGATGTEVIDRLRRELDPEIPALLVSGSMAPELAREAAANGCALMLKPVQPEKLRELIDGALRKTG
jgi:CheY-like chemotaxis protein